MILTGSLLPPSTQAEIRWPWEGVPKMLWGFIILIFLALCQVSGPRATFQNTPPCPTIKGVCLSPMDMSGNVSPNMSAKSPSSISPKPSEVISKILEPKDNISKHILHALRSSFYLRSSYIEDRHNFKNLLNMIWSFKLKFKI